MDVGPPGHANEGGREIEFIVDNLEKEDWRARGEEQALEEDKENDDYWDDDDVPDASVLDAWNRHDSGGLVVCDGHDSPWEHGQNVVRVNAMYAYKSAL